MLEVHLAIRQIGDGQERRLHGDAADRVGDGEARFTRGGGQARRDDARQRGGGADEQRPGESLADAGPVGQRVGHTGERQADDQQGEAAGEEARPR